MELFCKKTNDFTGEELEQLSILFETVFRKKRSKSLLLSQYVHNVLGYSYHSVIVDKGKIVALNTYVPAYYLYNGEKYLFANSIDSMVEKPYRDFFNFQDMVDNAYDYMRKEGVSFVYGYPNDQSFPVLSKSELMREIGQMKTYCLPYRIGGIKHSLKCFNWLSVFFCKFFVSFSGLFSSSKIIESMIQKDESSYNETRYKRSDGKYTIIKQINCNFIYKVKEHEGVKTAFLIDVYPKSARNFNKAVKYIIQHNSKEFDVLLYPGFLSVRNTGLIELPRKIEPKIFYFTGKILNPKLIDDSVWNIEKWDTNLSNYDLI